MGVLAPIRFREYLRHQPIGAAELAISDAPETQGNPSGSENSEHWSVSYVAEASVDSGCGDAQDSRTPACPVIRRVGGGRELASVAARAGHGIRDAQAAETLQAEFEAIHIIKSTLKLYQDVF
jgi:hypothetical protein